MVLFSAGIDGQPALQVLPVDALPRATVAGSLSDLAAAGVEKDGQWGVSLSVPLLPTRQSCP